MSNDRQIPFDSEIVEGIGREDRHRKQHGLPPLDLSRELDRIHRVRERKEFERWMKSPLRYRVQQKLLQRLRRKVGKPDWQPTGVLSGGGWTFHVTLARQMQRLRARLG